MQPFWLKMPKRDRGADTGVWAVSDSPDGDDAAMVTHPAPAQPAEAAPPQGVATRCPYPTCTLCAWGVPPAQHKDHVFIHSTYEKKMKTLEEEPMLTAAVKCEQSQILNCQLMVIERALFDAGDIKEHDALGPLTCCHLLQHQIMRTYFLYPPMRSVEHWLHSWCQRRLHNGRKEAISVRHIDQDVMFSNVRVAKGICMIEKAQLHV